MRAAGPRAVGRALALALASAGPAAAADDIWQPCLAAASETGVPRSAFLAAGWSEPAGRDLAAAQGRINEVRMTIALLPVFATRADLDAFLAEAHAVAAAQLEGFGIYARGGTVAAVRSEDLYGSRTVTCIITGPDLPAVAAALSAPGAGARRGLSYAARPIARPGVEGRIDFLRHEPPVAGRPLDSRDAVVLGYLVIPGDARPPKGTGGQPGHP